MATSETGVFADDVVGVYDDEQRRTTGTRQNIRNQARVQSADHANGLGFMISQVIRDASELMDLKIRLFKRELADTVVGYAKDGAMLAVGGVLLFFTLIFLNLSLVYLFAWLLPFSQEVALLCGAVIVTLLNGIAGGFLLKKGLNRMSHRSIVPERSVNELKRDKEWIRNKII